MIIVVGVAALSLSAGGAVASGAPTDRQPAAAYTGCLDSLGKHFPAMTLVVVAGLLEERARVEIEATAVVGTG